MRDVEFYCSKTRNTLFQLIFRCFLLTGNEGPEVISVPDIPGGVTRYKSLFRLISTSNRNWSNGTIRCRNLSFGTANLWIFIRIQRSAKRYRSFFQTALFFSGKTSIMSRASFTAAAVTGFFHELQLAVKSGAFFSLFILSLWVSEKKHRAQVCPNLKHLDARYTTVGLNTKRCLKKSQMLPLRELIAPRAFRNFCVTSTKEELHMKTDVSPQFNGTRNKYAFPVDWL